MNIIVKTYSENIVFRPDISLLRENMDYYVPSFIDKLSFSPILFIRIAKTGKFIAKRFAERYYDAINYGMLIYPQDIIDQDKEGSFAQAHCFNHTSVLPQPLYNIVTLEKEDNAFTIVKNDNDHLYSCQNKDLIQKDSDIKNIIHQALVEASKCASLRIGDFLAIEIGNRQDLINREEGDKTISLSYCENQTANFEIFF